jgi:hypothetical protein
MVMTLMSIVGFTTNRRSTVESEISGNHLLYHLYFFAAEAGIERAIKTLEEEFIHANMGAVANGMAASWDFAFAGGDQITGTEDDVFDMDKDGMGSYPEGAVWFDNTPIGAIAYQVKLWNNDDTKVGGTFLTDRDGIIWVRCDATGPKGGGVSIQVLLQGRGGGPVVVDYTAQSGMGAGSNFISDDFKPILNFDRQL